MQIMLLFGLMGCGAVSKDLPHELQNTIINGNWRI
jgi:hypothetical protein